MRKVDINVWADSAQIDPSSNNSLQVVVNGVGIDDLVQQAGTAELLDEIGEDACREHFNIEAD